MRVLLTTDTVGGVWTYTKDLTEGLLNHGHAVALVSFGGLPSPAQGQWTSDTISHFGNSFSYTPSDVPLEWMPENDRAHLTGAALLDRIAADFHPDLLHSNQFCFGSVDLDLPRLVVAHSDVLSWAAACTPSGLLPSPWLDCYVHLVQNGLNEADALVAPTRWMLGALAANFTPPARQHVIANGRTLADPDTTFPRRPQAVSAGRMADPSKNLALLLGVHACPLLIAGSLDRTPQTPDHSATVTPLGFLPESELLDLLRTSKIYIAASLYEPFGLAPLEAALCGCAIVANDLDSFREVWGPAALYFRSAEELDQQLTRLLNDDSLFTRMQALALQQARTYTATAMTTSYLDLYADLLHLRSSTHLANEPSSTYAN